MKYGWKKQINKGLLKVLFLYKIEILKNSNINCKENIDWILINNFHSIIQFKFKYYFCDKYEHFIATWNEWNKETSLCFWGQVQTSEVHNELLAESVFIIKM